MDEERVQSMRVLFSLCEALIFTYRPQTRHNKTAEPIYLKCFHCSSWTLIYYFYWKSCQAAYFLTLFTLVHSWWPVKTLRCATQSRPHFLSFIISCLIILISLYNDTWCLNTTGSVDLAYWSHFTCGTSLVTSEISQFNSQVFSTLLRKARLTENANKQMSGQSLPLQYFIVRPTCI
jgi:hypothetical protein